MFVGMVKQMTEKVYGKPRSTPPLLLGAFSRLDKEVHFREKFEEQEQEIERIRNEIEAEQKAFDQKINKET